MLMCKTNQADAARRLQAERSEPLRWERRANALPRAQIDDVLLAARHLPLRDRALVDGVYRQGMSIAAIARITGMRPHGLRRRLRLIMRRLRSPTFRYVLREVMTGGAMAAARRSTRAAADGDADSTEAPGARNGLTADQRRAIAQAIVFDRRPQREVARQLNLTLHQVRREIERIRTLAECM